jgi:hypothetical protein
LGQALDLTASAEGISIHAGRYRDDQFIIGLDCERAGSGPGGGVSYTGINTSGGGGATIRLEMKNINAFAGDSTVNPPQTSQVVDRVYLTLVHSVKITLKKSGVDVWN